MNIKEQYQKFLNDKGFSYESNDTVRPYDQTTLFCPSGMQQFKKLYRDESFRGTFCNLQSCLRVNDLEEIGDGSHLLYFNMLGMFSFRELTVKQAIDLWMEFLVSYLNIKPDYITVHPDKKEWKKLYQDYDVEVREDSECTWSDGEIGGFCTEFFKDGIEIGNIVNPLGTCIDVGFGLERLDMVVNDNRETDDLKVLKEAINKIIESGYKPSNLMQGYVLRKLLRILYKKKGSIEHRYFSDEVSRQEKILNRYERLKEKNPGKSKEWWYDTHGIQLDDL